MKPASTQQVKAINAILAQRKMMADKPEIISSFTDGRTEHSKELYFEEANAMLQFLIDKNQNSGMMRKLFAMAIEIGWCPFKSEVQADGTIKKGRSYQAVHNWVLKSGYLHKKLSAYSYEQLPKLVTQFEIGPYSYYLSKHSKNE